MTTSEGCMLLWAWPLPEFVMLVPLERAISNSRALRRKSFAKYWRPCSQHVRHSDSKSPIGILPVKEPNNK